MQIRDTQDGDLESVLLGSPKEYDKLHPPAEAEEAITMLDDEGIPRLVMKAQRVAEVYLAIDHRYQTPAMRWAMIERCHAEMQRRLLGKGYNVAYSFFADGVPNGYIRRLVRLGWSRMVERCVRFAAGRS
jgi:hypothetical protein